MCIFYRWRWKWCWWWWWRWCCCWWWWWWWYSKLGFFFFHFLCFQISFCYSCKKIKLIEHRHSLFFGVMNWRPSFQRFWEMGTLGQNSSTLASSWVAGSPAQDLKIGNVGVPEYVKTRSDFILQISTFVKDVTRKFETTLVAQLGSWHIWNTRNYILAPNKYYGILPKIEKGGFLLPVGHRCCN